jgi:serine/threonine protein kinase
MIEKELPQIPGYVIKEKLGEGGMASIYLAVQEKLEREVAIKVLNPKLIKDQQILKRFKNEAHSAAKLIHPNIITIYDVDQSGDTYYIVMEYLKESLRDRVKARGKLPPTEALEIIKKIAGALGAAHAKGIIHRDIKPDNVMFRPDGNPVLLDFGIARALDLNTRITMIGVSIGTPHYMSPEQCRGEEIDGRSDIYSLGVLLFELLTGKVPYTAEYPTGLIYLHTHGQTPQLPGELNKYQPLIDAMMTKDRGTRVQDGAELVKLIQRLENGLIPIEYETGPPPIKRKIVLAWGSIIAILMGFLVYFFIVPGVKKITGNADKLLKVPAISLEMKWFPFPGILSTSQPQKKTGPPSELKDIKDNQIKEYLTLVKKLFAEGKYKEAGETLEKAKKIKRSSEIDELERKIKEKIADREKAAEYSNYFNLALESSKESNFDKALEYTAAARRLKQTDELDRLEIDIKTKQEKTKIKTVNFVDLPREKIAELNDHIKRIEIPGLEPGIIVGGEIALNFLVDEKGGIEIKQYDDSRLIINPVNKKEVVKTMILEKIRRIPFNPQEDETGKPQKIENWRKEYQLATFQGTIILY